MEERVRDNGGGGEKEENMSPYIECICENVIKLTILYRKRMIMVSENILICIFVAVMKFSADRITFSIARIKSFVDRIAFSVTRMTFSVSRITFSAESNSRGKGSF